MRNILILILAVLVPLALQRIKIPGKPEEKQETSERSRKRKGGKTVTQYAPRLTKKFVQTCQQEYVAFDTETTGLSSKTDRIIEISAVRFRNFVPVESWSKVTDTTDYLILGDHGHFPEDGFTQKRSDAERRIAEGSNLQILTEDQFLDLLAAK